MKPKQQWRVIRDNITEPCMHFAVEEALLRLTDENYSLPTLRLRKVEPSVWIGYYQQPSEDVDLDFCQKNNLKIVRRLNSGGAVYQDYGTFCYSAFINKIEFFQHYSINHTDELYQLFGNTIVGLCQEIGIQAKLSPINDITVGERKIYGSAQLDWYSAFAHSGSVLVNVDRDAMQAALKPSNLKFADKGFTNVKDRVVNISELTSSSITVDYVMQIFKDSFPKTLNVALVEDELTKSEKDLANKLYREKYSLQEWTFPKVKNYTTAVSAKIPSGVLILKCEHKGKRIESIKIQGDLLIPNHSEITTLSEGVRGKSFSESYTIIEKSLLPKDVRDGIKSLLKQIEESL